MKKSTPRQTAIANNDSHYRSGRDCKQNHKNPLRKTVNGTCKDCSDIAQVTYREKHRKTSGPTRKYKPRVYKEVIITEEEHKHETFKQMAQRIYDKGQTW